MASHRTAAASATATIVLDRLEPMEGPAYAETHVTITGRGLTDVERVEFCGSQATNLRIHSATTLSCDTPKLPPGKCSVIAYGHGQHSNAMEFAFYSDGK